MVTRLGWGWCFLDANDLGLVTLAVKTGCAQDYVVLQVADLSKSEKCLFRSMSMYGYLPSYMTG